MSIGGGRRRRGVGMVLAVAFVASWVTAVPASASVDIRFKERPVAGWSTNGTVYAVALVGDVVYIGGDFTHAVSPSGNVTRERHNLAAFDRITGELLAFRADANAVVRDIAVHGNTAWVGGHFSEIGGFARERVAALDASSGAVRAGFSPNVNGVVWDVEYVKSRVYIGGEFSKVDGQTQRAIASLDPNTGEPHPEFAARASGTVRALVYSLERDTLYAGGSFTSIGGTSRDKLAGLDTQTGDAKGPVFANPDSLVLDVDVADDGSKVFAAVGGNRNRAEAWDASNGSRRWHRIAMGDVQAVSYEDGLLYFGFHEGYGGSTSVKLLAANATTGSLDNSFRPNVNSFFGIWAIDAAPGALIAGGQFTRVEGIKTKGFAIHPRDGVEDLTPPSIVTGIHAVSASADSIEVAWTPATDDVGISRYVIRRDGVVVGNAPSAVYVDEGLMANTTYEYTVEALDSVERSSGISAPASLTTWSVLVSAGSDWSYRDTGSAPSAWPTRSFDDSSWETGAAPLGFGDGDESTKIDSGEISYYFRTDFTTPGGREVLDASLSVVRDDGAVVYVNGVEVFRTNMPDGVIDASSRASSSTGGADESRWYTSSVPASLFKPGVNVIAVEVHQRSASSSDVSFDLRLAADLSTEPFDEEPPSRPTRLTATVKTPQRIRLDWAAATDNRAIDGYLVYRDGKRIGFTRTRRFVDNGLEPDREYTYKVFARDTSLNRGPRSRIQRATTLADITPPTKPGALRADEIGGTNLTLRWAKAADNVAVDYYVVRRNGVTVATTAATSLTIDGLTPETEYLFAVRAVDTSGNRGAKSRIRQATTPLIVTFKPVAAGAQWRYRDDGSDLGSSWKQPGFDVSAWSRGRAELGYGDGDEATVIDDGPSNRRHITSYFVAKFTLSNVAAIAELQLRLIRDDGAVVYINGVEVFRSNMRSGSIDADTRALQSISGSAESSWVVAGISLEALVAGANTIAVEIHQAGPRSSDVSFNLELIANP